MDYFGLIFYQLLILFAFCRFGRGQVLDYDMKTLRVSVAGVVGMEGRTWESVRLSKFMDTDEFIFQDDELTRLCDGTFSHEDVEIVEVFGFVVKFSVEREPNPLLFTVLFAERSSVSKFFSVIRWRQKKGCGKVLFKMRKMFQYRISDAQNDEERLQLLAESAEVHLKNINAFTIARPKTVTFAQHRYITPTESVYLVLQSLTFNLSREIAPRTYILCARNISTHRFILVFPDDKAVKSVFSTSSFAHDLNPTIPCPIDWITSQILEQVR